MDLQGVGAPARSGVPATSDGAEASPLAVGGVVGGTVAGAALHRRMPTTAFGPIQKLWVPALAGSLALAAGTGAAAGLHAAGGRTGLGADALDAAAGALGVGTVLLLSRGQAAQRGNLASLARTGGGVLAGAAAADAAIRHGSAALEDAGLAGGSGATVAAVAGATVAGAALAYGATRGVHARNATYTGERAFGYAIGERIDPQAVTPLPTVSLGAASTVPQDTIGKIGKKFLEGAIPAERIAAATGRDAVDPARVFVGFHSAPTVEGRLDLFRREVERLGVIGGANHRDTIVMVSPAGALVDYVATDARELLTGGNVAHLAIAFSDRPALASLDRVPDGIRQFREAVAHVRDEIAKLPPERRPKLEVYGESIGGIVGEQAVLKGGIAGLDELGVDRALFVGSPSAGRAKRAVLAAESGAEAPRALRFAGLDDALARHDADVMRTARVQFLEHSEDAITSLRPRRIWQATPVPEGSVVRNQAAHLPFVSFSHMVGDAINFQMPPGRLGTRGHHYAGDLPGVLRQLHPEVGDDQMRGVVEVVRRQEATRSRLRDVPDLPIAFTDGSTAPATEAAR